MEETKIKEAVQENYGKIAENSANSGCCAPSTSNSSSCCDGSVDLNSKDISKALGYSDDDMESVPDAANMGLGCGNPQAIAKLKKGERVLDLGSGGGFDAFLAAKAVGKDGYVYGVDMTPQMISLSRENTKQLGHKNVEFLLGEIENIPLANDEVDVIISNCVINLSPDKEAVFNEAFRVLKAGGRLAISDVVASTELPKHIKNDLALHTGCIAGASQVDELQRFLEETGFTSIEIKPQDESREFIKDWLPNSKIEDYVISATIEAIKA